MARVICWGASPLLATERDRGRPAAHRQFGWALMPALALLVLWELGKLVTRRRLVGRESPTL